MTTAAQKAAAAKAAAAKAAAAKAAAAKAAAAKAAAAKAAAAKAAADKAAAAKAAAAKTKRSPGAVPKAPLPVKPKAKAAPPEIAAIQALKANGMHLSKHQTGVLAQYAQGTYVTPKTYSVGLPADVTAVQNKLRTGVKLSAHESHILTMWNKGQYQQYLKDQAVGQPKPGDADGDGIPDATDPDTPAEDPVEDTTQQYADRDAQILLQNLFHEYGLDSLSGKVVDYIKQGYGADAITVLLSQTPEYKQRFAANDLRIKQGLPALSPAEYIATERSYRSIMSASGLPNGFYDTQADFTGMIANDISPTELQGRVDAATDAINKAPGGTLGYFKQWYSTGDLIAYALDPNKAAPLVEKRIKAAETAAIASAQGVNMNQLDSENIAGQGLSLDQTRQGFGIIGQELPTAEKLSNIYGGADVGQTDLVNEVFFQDAQSTVNRQKLGQQEQAAFSGSSGTNSSSLMKNNKL
jgi:hypothetical protein